ncbi:restriction endonuclease subunit S [Vagococcus luciliae]|uniref:Type-1 restriction enzyme EcoKI specificity protein n=1 Tax=Vagococcus luciliae TaxID=2920380 RepID=A0ABY5NZI4_9ENTE|nr:restriction endonuclease subunit S [Vagococcus luciliae]UUV99064.1 Type-1 restriction enzyme EcoKI specificity protein [Vagococcus luciliae]
MTSNHLAPVIRFKGFTDAWEQRKLGDITKKIGSGKTPKGGNSTYLDVGIPLIRSQNIFGNRLDFTDIAYISKDTDNEMKNSRVNENDVLLNITGASIGRSAVYREKFTANVNQHVCIIRPEKHYSSNFIQLNLSSYKGQKEVELNQAGGGREGLNFKQISKMSFYYPNYNEQTKIGNFFKQLDGTIALHQRELDLLKEQKKGFLQKMFPKKDEVVPEIRFAGFTDAWEQRKVSDITLFHKQGYYTKEEYSDTKKYYLLRGTELTSNSLRLDDTPKINATEKDYEDFRVKKNDFLIVRSGTVGTYSIIYEDIPAIFGSYLINFRFNLSIVTNEFFGYFYQSELFKSQLLKIVQQSSNININAENIKSTLIMLPSIEEQTKIGNFFKQLDDTIALHQCELEKLQEMKKAFLQKMFV